MNEGRREKADMILSEKEMERVSGGRVTGCQIFYVCECGAEYEYNPPVVCGRCGNRDMIKYSLRCDYDTPL
jgi:hypothetical protein